MNQTILNVAQWGKDRKFDAPNGSTLMGQFMKLMEEMGEATEALEERNREHFVLEVGDNFVVGILYAVTYMQQDKDGGQLLLEDINVVLGQVTDNDYPNSWGNAVGLLKGRTNHTADLRSLQIASGWLATAINKRQDLEYHGAALHNYLSAWAEICACLGVEPAKCLEAAYNKIKDRKGEWRDGMFIKEADL